jgi:hypothetical protein
MGRKIYGTGGGELTAIIRAYQEGRLNGLDLDRPTRTTVVVLEELPKASAVLNQLDSHGRTLESLLDAPPGPRLGPAVAG